MTNIYFSTYIKVFELLTAAQKKSFFSIQFLILFTSAVDLLGLALFVPVLSAISDRSLLKDDEPLGQLKSITGVQDENTFLLLLFALAFIFFLCRSLFILFSQWIQSRFIHSLSESIGKRTYAFFLGNDYEDILRRDSSKVVRELTASPQHFSKFLIMPLLLLTSEVFILIIIICGISWYDFNVFLMLVLTIFPVAYLFNRLTKRSIRRFGVLQNDLMPQLLNSSTRGIFGIIDVRLRGKEEKLLSDYGNLLHQLNAINIKTAVLGIVPAKLFELSTLGGLLLIFYYGAFMAQHPEVIMPLIALYAAAGYRLVPSLSKILPAFQSLEHYQYLFPIFRQALLAKLKLRSEEKQVMLFNRKIRIQDMTFGFAETRHTLFEDFNLEIKKGEIVGLIGRSGSGKTTLVNIISGFLFPKKGVIFVDDVLLNENSLASWMRGISYVQQAPYLEKGSLSKNIAFLDDDIDQERMNQAIVMSSLSEFVNGRDPHEILVEENGKNLSGGQKQRVIIARALYHNANLIILDEATSALDNETENDVNQTVNMLKGRGITIIIIAHRYSTLKHTDRIIRLDHGRIAEETVYANLQSSQFDEG